MIGHFKALRVRDMLTRGQRVRTRRREKGMSQNTLARLAGITQPAISALENDHYEGSTAFPAIARALETTVDWIETGDERLKNRQRASTTSPSPPIRRPRR